MPFPCLFIFFPFPFACTLTSLWVVVVVVVVVVKPPRDLVPWLMVLMPIPHLSFAAILGIPHPLLTTLLFSPLLATTMMCVCVCVVAAPVLRLVALIDCGGILSFPPIQIVVLRSPFGP